ncbi:MAG: chemotaxis protein [Clostridiales bacterium]|jgi:two-component system chemotaxis response regulator CheV|nr:chemotaxis protein [Clostridiales bacterium]
MNQINKNEILLETGTNELEVLEFSIANRYFGINVSKVLEIMQSLEVTPMPNSNPFIEGVFKPRNDIMTLINLPAYMGLPSSESTERDIYIITNFNQSNFAFHVHSVEEIHRISWESIEKPDSAIYGGTDGLATGIARIGDRLITIIDFEKIITDINPESGIQLSEIERLGAREANNKPILIAEDSPLLERMIVEALGKSGYSNVICCTNGKEAWDLLKSFKNNGKSISNYVTCVITDIEMPQMDGHRLTKLIRGDEDLKVLPIIIFSSLINEEMKEKGKSIGATAQISKPEIGNLVHLIDQYSL